MRSWGGSSIHSLLSLVCFAVDCRICWSRFRSSSLVLLRCWALVLFSMVCAKLAAAAVIASAGVTVGLVRYLCFRNAVAVMRVVLVSLDQWNQHR